MAARVELGSSTTTTIVDFLEGQDQLLTETIDENSDRQACVGSIQKLIAIMKKFRDYDDYVSWGIRYWGLEIFPTDLASFKQFVAQATTPEGVSFLQGKVQELKTRILVTPWQVPFKGEPRLQGAWTLNEDELTRCKQLFPKICIFDGQPYETAQRVHEFVAAMFDWIADLPPEIQDFQVEAVYEETLSWGPLHITRYLEYMNRENRALQGPSLRRVDSDPRILTAKNYDLAKQIRRERKELAAVALRAVDYWREEESRWDVQEFALACTQLKNRNEQERETQLLEFQREQEQSRTFVTQELQIIDQKMEENQQVAADRLANANERCAYVEGRLDQAEQVVADLSAKYAAVRQENNNLRVAIGQALQAAQRRPRRFCSIQ